MASSNEIRDDYVFRATLDDKVTTPAQQAAVSLDHLGDTAEATAASLSAANQANQAIAAGLDKVASAGQVGTRTFQNLQRSLDPAASAVEQLSNRLEQLDRLYQQGKVNADQYNTLQASGAFRLQQAREKQEELNRSLENGAGVSRRVQFAMRDLGLQSIDMFQGIATGQPILRTFLQQGSQVVQVNAAMGVSFKETASSVLAMIGGWKGLVAIGVVGTLAAIAVEVEKNQRGLLALQTTIRGTHDNYQQLAAQAQAAARAIASSTTATSAEATAAASIIASSANWAGTQKQLQDVIGVANDVAAIMGTKLPDAAKMMADALQNPGKVAQDLADKHLFGFNQQLARSIELQGQAGDKAGAFTRVLDQIREKSAGAAREGLTPLQQMFNDLTNNIQSNIDKISEWANKVAKVIGDQMSGAAKVRQELKDQGGPLLPFSGPSQSTSDLISRYSQQYGLNTAQQQFANRVAYQESGGYQNNIFGNTLTSSKGALGAFQLLPSTAADLGVNPNDAAQNVEGGVKYISQLFQKYGDPGLVALAYNWGPGNVDKFLAGTKSIGDIPQESRTYVQRVAGKSVDSLVHGVVDPGIIDVSGASSSSGARTGVDVDQAYKDALNLGSQAKSAADAKAKIDEYTAALAKLRSDGETTGDRVNTLTIALTKQTDEYNHIINPLLKDTEALQDQAKAAGQVGRANQELTDILTRAARARQQGEGPTDAQVQQQIVALTQRQTAAFQAQIATIDQNIAAADKQAAAWEGGAAAFAKASAAAEAHKQVQDTLNSTTNNTAEAEAQLTQKLLEQAAGEEKVKAAQESSHIQDQLSVIQLETSTLGQNNDQRELAIQHLQDEIDLRNKYPNLIASGNTQLLAERDALAQSGQALRNHKADLDYLAGQFSSAFDTIGDAITQAFVQGEGQAVNFGNVMKGVASQVIQAFLRLSVINPILNGLFGQNNPTIFSVANTIGSQGGFLSQGIFGTSTAEQQNLVYSDLIKEGGGLDNPLGTGSTTSLAPTGLFGGASIGSLGLATLGGFSLGSVAGGITQKALNKTGPGPQIGAAGGALAGAAIGSIIPGIGTVIGGLIGGVIGGAGGGLIGPKPPSPYAATFVGIGPNGELTVSPSLSAHQITDSNLADIQNQATQFNQAQQQLGVRIIGTAAAPKAGAAGGLGFFGTATNLAGIQGQNIQDAFSNIRFGAAAGVQPETAQVLDRYINAKAFSSFDQLGQAVNKVKGFVEQTVPALLKMGSAAGSLQDAIDNINNQFTPAIATAKELGYQEQALTEARDKAIAAAQRAADEQFAALPEQYLSREATAAAALSNDPNQILAAQQRAFDVQANAERKQLRDNLVSTYGEAIQQSQLYADLSLDLEKALGAERLAIQKQSNDAINDNSKQAAAQLLTSIADYTRGLRFSQASPLSPQAQLEAAQSQFNAVSGAAAAGDANSLDKLTSYSDTLLNAARQVYGSGEGYVQVFTQVTDALNRVASVSPDTLTASIFALETRAQTDTLVAALSSLQNEVAGLKAQLNSNAAMPARLAA